VYHPKLFPTLFNLLGAIENITSCCEGKLGGRVFILSCNLRFEVYRFYDPIADAPPPSPPPEVSPSPSTNISSTKGIRVIIIN
jgi:hypothetical protein